MAKAKKSETVDTLAQAEKAKYEKMWALDAYRNVSPAVRELKRFFDLCQPFQTDWVLDMGAGTGRAALEIFRQGLNVKMVDITETALDEEVRAQVHEETGRSFEFPTLLFQEASLWDPEAFKSKVDWVFCCDVMEHIPEEKVWDVFKNAASVMQKGGYFQICTIQEGFGRRIDEVLHLTVKPAEWWIDEISQHFKVVKSVTEPMHVYIQVAPKE